MSVAAVDGFEGEGGLGEGGWGDGGGEGAGEVCDEGGEYVGGEEGGGGVGCGGFLRWVRCGTKGFVLGCGAGGRRKESLGLLREYINV